MIKYDPKLREPSRDLRSNQTDPEKILWSKLRRKQILGIQFYRQKPIGHYIVDFYGPKAQLVIEVDGSQHLEENHAFNDKQRDEFLIAQGLHVLRFSNVEVVKNIEGVMEEILMTIRKGIDRTNPPNPPFSKGGI